MHYVLSTLENKHNLCNLKSIKNLKMKPRWFLSITNKPLRVYILMFTILLVFLITYFTLQPKHRPGATLGKMKFMATQEPPFEGARLVHLDLKGAPFKISYYKSLFPLLAQMGATGVLIEYEDMFPYGGPLLSNVSAFNAYSTEDVKVINDEALNNNLEVIPLIQSFGHLEFLLKLEEFSDMREVPEYPQVICPSHLKTINIIMEMIEQIMALHPKSKLLHIGADEVYYLGYCDRCSSLMTKNNITKNILFLEHVNEITSRIRQKYPKLRILMWDDEFRNFPLRDLQQINEFIEPVIWKYTKDAYEDLGPSLWESYSGIFQKVWAGSAFKGATGSKQYINDAAHYVQNHRSWLALIWEHRNLVHFEGIIITGWQRYDHFAVLCDLLPASLPSLAMCLRIIHGHRDSPLSPPAHVARLLNCERPYALMGPAFGSPHCSYPGADVLEGVIKLHQLQQEWEELKTDSRAVGWLDAYNQKHAYSSPQMVQAVTVPLSKIKVELDQLEAELTEALEEVYDRYTVDEWMETYLWPLKNEVKDLEEARGRILGKSVWPRRPLGEL